MTLIFLASLVVTGSAFMGLARALNKQPRRVSVRIHR